MATSADYFRPELIAALGGTRLRAAYIADGWIAGGHVSRRLGSSLDLAEHKSYSPGDEVRHIDWKLHARTDRYYVRRFEDETNRLFHLMVDCSGSMSYRGRQSVWSKWTCAATIAASISLVIQAGGDAIGWSIHGGHKGQGGGAEDERDRGEITRSAATVSRLADRLDQLQPGGSTDLGAAIELLRQRLRRRAVLVAISDWLDPPARYSAAIANWLAAGHQLFAIHVLDPDELDFPTGQVERLIDLEDASEVRVDPLIVRDRYRELFERHQRQLQEALRPTGGWTPNSRLCIVDTSQSLAPALVHAFAGRQVVL